MKENKSVKPPLKFDEMTNDRLAEGVFGKKLTKKLKRVARSSKHETSSD